MVQSVNCASGERCRDVQPPAAANRLLVCFNILSYLERERCVVHQPEAPRPRQLRLGAGEARGAAHHRCRRKAAAARRLLRLRLCMRLPRVLILRLLLALVVRLRPCLRRLRLHLRFMESLVPNKRSLLLRLLCLLHLRRLRRNALPRSWLLPRRRGRGAPGVAAAAARGVLKRTSLAIGAACMRAILAAAAGAALLRTIPAVAAALAAQAHRGDVVQPLSRLCQVLGEQHAAERVAGRADGRVREAGADRHDREVHVLRHRRVVAARGRHLQPVAAAIVEHRRAPAAACRCVAHPLAVALVASAVDAVHHQQHRRGVAGGGGAATAKPCMRPDSG
mmetsp:Transcript_38264/g.113403  ORF Transcript_38264/g.113403 Transcript_38264/m.113403 type:complete len:336 (+) Transcript_38264:649-1656(+)